MKAPASTLLTAVTLLMLSLSTRTARADAVLPPPEHCPKGQVGVTSHGGPECVPEAPKNCAPGYRGIVRGSCVLATCSSDDNCEGGRRCLQIDVCQEYRELYWTGWGWGAQKEVQRDNSFGGPPAPPPEGPPKKGWVLLNICGQDGPCQAPAQCRAAGLCYPPDAIGKTQAKIAGASPVTTPTSGNDTSGGTGGPYVASGGTASVPSGNPAPNTSPDARAGESGGCRKGCSATSASSSAGWLALLPLAGVGWLRRRRRSVVSRRVPPRSD